MKIMKSNLLAELVPICEYEEAGYLSAEIPMYLPRSRHYTHPEFPGRLFDSEDEALCAIFVKELNAPEHSGLKLFEEDCRMSVDVSDYDNEQDLIESVGYAMSAFAVATQSDVDLLRAFVTELYYYDLYDLADFLNKNHIKPGKYFYDHVADNWYNLDDRIAELTAFAQLMD
jgi:hypothetical protein